MPYVASSSSHSNIERKDFTYLYKGQPIHFNAWFKASSQSVTTIFFLGTVQINELPKWVAEKCPHGTVVVQGAPHWFARNDGTDIPEYIFGFTKAAFTNILKTFPVDRTLRILADSQAVPGVLQLFSLKKYERYIADIVLFQPLGLNTPSYSGDDKQRVKKFRKRLTHNVALQITSLLFDKRYRYNYRLVSDRINFRDPVAMAQYNSGLMYDATSDLRKLWQAKKKITIICGSKDKVFPPKEIKGNLLAQKIDIRVLSVPGVAHTSLAVRSGQKLLEAAFASTKSTKRMVMD